MDLDNALPVVVKESIAGVAIPLQMTSAVAATEQDNARVLDLVAVKG